jgi:CubicO group peptidase (beta-lactamase class C family)
MYSAAGLSAAGLNGLHAAVERHVGDEKVPGLVTLVARGGQVHVEALGRLAVGGPPVARDSIFRIASTTKPITAAATLALAAEGLIGLDEPVDRLPGRSLRSARLSPWTASMFTAGEALRRPGTGVRNAERRQE